MVGLINQNQHIRVTGSRLRNSLTKSGPTRAPRWYGTVYTGLHRLHAGMVYTGLHGLYDDIVYTGLPGLYAGIVYTGLHDLHAHSVNNGLHGLHDGMAYAASTLVCLHWPTSAPRWYGLL